MVDLASLKKEIEELKKMESGILHDTTYFDETKPVETIRNSLNGKKDKVGEFSDFISSVNDKILDLRSSYDEAESKFLDILKEKSRAFMNKSEIVKLNKEVEELRKKKKEVYSIKLLKLDKRAIPGVGAALVNNLEKLDEERKGLKNKVKKLVEQREHDFDILKEKFDLELKGVSERFNSELKVQNAKIDELYRTKKAKLFYYNRIRCKSIVIK